MSLRARVVLLAWLVAGIGFVEVVTSTNGWEVVWGFLLLGLGLLAASAPRVK